MSNPDRRHINLVLDETLNRVVRREAHERGVAVSVVVREALSAYYAPEGHSDDPAWRSAYTAALGELRRRIEAALGGDARPSDP